MCQAEHKERIADALLLDGFRRCGAVLWDWNLPGRGVQILPSRGTKINNTFVFCFMLLGYDSFVAIHGWQYFTPSQHAGYLRFLMMGKVCIPNVEPQNCIVQ